MLNKEKYGRKIIELAIKGCDLAVVNGKPVSCVKTRCNDCACHDSDKDCQEFIKEWANSEYIKFVDWNKIQVDTPILVKNRQGEIWYHRYFYKYDNGKIYSWEGGTTSWSNSGFCEDWEMAKLATD